MALTLLCRPLLNLKPVTTHFKTVCSKLHILKHSQNRILTQRSLKPIQQKRTYFWIFRHQTRKEVTAKDQAPQEYQLIYRNAIDHYYLVGHLFTFASAVIVFFLVAIREEDITKEHKLPFPDENMWGSRSRETKNELLVYLTAFVLITLIFQFMLYRMPMRIYYYPEKKKYMFCFNGSIPFTIRKQFFNMGEIVHAPSDGISMWRDITYVHKSGQKLVLHDNYFRRPADLYIMLGVQKDPDHM